jgi:hypothetical protein
MLRYQRLRPWRAIIAQVTQRRRQEAQQASAVSMCNETVLGEAFHPLTGSNRTLPSTAVRGSVGFAGRITGQHFVIQGWGGVEGRRLQLGQHRG